MGRVSRVDDDRVFAAVARRMATDGSLRLQSVVEDTGVSVGSLYHRYGSREGLLARTWLDAVRSFHDRVLAALQSGRPDADEETALATPRFCREERPRAIVLLSCRRSEFLNEATPPELKTAIDDANRDAAAALARFAEDRGVKLDACRMGIVAFPLGAVRFYLPYGKVPEQVDDYVRVACRAALAAGRIEA